MLNLCTLTFWKTAYPSEPKNAATHQKRKKFVQPFVSELEGFGFIKPTTEAEWVAVALIIPKPPPADFCFTTDLWTANAVRKPMTWPMPSLNSKIGDMRKSTCYASVDFSSSFWKLALHEAFPHIQGFIAYRGVVIPSRTLQGRQNCAQNFQAEVAPCFNEMSYSLKVWIDDFTIHNRTKRE